MIDAGIVWWAVAGLTLFVVTVMDHTLRGIRKNIASLLTSQLRSQWGPERSGVDEIGPWFDANRVTRRSSRSPDLANRLTRISLSPDDAYTIDKIITAVEKGVPPTPKRPMPPVDGPLTC